MPNSTFVRSSDCLDRSKAVAVAASFNSRRTPMPMANSAIAVRNRPIWLYLRAVRWASWNMSSSPNPTTAIKGSPSRTR